MRFIFALMVVLGACSADEPPAVDSAGLCADVVAVEVEGSPDGSYTFTVTVASADEGWAKYADEWTVQAEDGTVLGTRTLLHPHDDEQPFTRSLTGVQIPEGYSTVVVAARDSVDGYCEATLEVEVP
ncbi:MAG: hypothetical protein OEY55_15570 [Acidimicrobiia bacterium]|nr:hypothetical protein [Acidimicrobiia bacterium]